jgi:hypothetical protein
MHHKATGVASALSSIFPSNDGSTFFLGSAKRDVVPLAGNSGSSVQNAFAPNLRLSLCFPSVKPPCIDTEAVGAEDALILISEPVNDGVTTSLRGCSRVELVMLPRRGGAAAVMNSVGTGSLIWASRNAEGELAYILTDA